MAAAKKKTSAEKITSVPPTDLYERADHPVKMRDGASMRETIESVKSGGVLTLSTVRPRAEGGYEIIAGRRRKLACEAAGLEAIGGTMALTPAEQISRLKPEEQAKGNLRFTRSTG